MNRHPLVAAYPYPLPHHAHAAQGSARDAWQIISADGGIQQIGTVPWHLQLRSSLGFAGLRTVGAIGWRNLWDKKQQ